MSNHCEHCDRAIELIDGLWVDPEATGDDVIWRETCDQHDTFQAQHEPVWEDADASTYTAETLTVNGHVVTVCLDDEGPLRPAFYWDIDNRAIDGWASSVQQARYDACAAVQALAPHTHDDPDSWARDCQACYGND